MRPLFAEYLLEHCAKTPDLKEDTVQVFHAHRLDPHHQAHKRV